MSTGLNSCYIWMESFYIKMYINKNLLKRKFIYYSHKYRNHEEPDQLSVKFNYKNFKITLIYFYLGENLQSENGDFSSATVRTSDSLIRTFCPKEVSENWNFWFTELWRCRRFRKLRWQIKISICKLMTIW